MKPVVITFSKCLDHRPCMAALTSNAMREQLVSMVGTQVTKSSCMPPVKSLRARSTRQVRCWVCSRARAAILSVVRIDSCKEATVRKVAGSEALYWLVDVTGRRYRPPTDYPQFFYGFLSVAMAWQIAFLIIGSSPARFRSLMIPSMIEKFGYVATLAVLYGQARIAATDAQAAVPDLLLGILFIVAFAKTRAPEQRDA